MRVAVVGAGATGLYLAWKLAGKGNKVVVFEKKERIGKEACSGLFSERILEFIPQSRKLVENRIKSVLIHFPRKDVSVGFSRTFYIMSHFALDNLLCDLAKDRGAEIILNETINSVLEDFDRVIGCDGANSAVRKALKMPEPDFRLAIQGFIRKEDHSGFVETWPVRKGFIWKIPRGREVEYGIIADSKKVKELFDGFLKKNNLQLENLKSAIVPQGLSIPKNSSVTLCGDAAGLTKPWSGGGVIWGLFASDILLKYFPDFLKYQKEAERFFKPKILFSKMAVRLVYFLGFNLPWLLLKKVRIEGDFLF